MSSDRSLRREKSSLLRNKVEVDNQSSYGERELEDSKAQNSEVNGKGIGESSHFVENSEVLSGDETIVIEHENESENENEGSVYEDSEQNEQNAHSDESDYEMAFKFGSSFGHFDEGREDIESYISRLKSAMVVCKVPDDHKIALISSLGPEAYCTLRNLCVPVDPTTKSFIDCAKL
jgi:hypothetical protein